MMCKYSGLARFIILEAILITNSVFIHYDLVLNIYSHFKTNYSIFCYVISFFNNNKKLFNISI